MDGQALAKTFEFSQMALTRNLEGITHEESLRAPEPGGNALNCFHEGYHGGQIACCAGFSAIRAPSSDREPGMAHEEAPG